MAQWALPAWPSWSRVLTASPLSALCCAGVEEKQNSRSKVACLAGFPLAIWGNIVHIFSGESVVIHSSTPLVITC